MWEKDLDAIITDPDTRQAFRKSAERTSRDKPFVMESRDESLRKMVINLFSNHISSICSTNFILQDMDQEVNLNWRSVGADFLNLTNWDGGRFGRRRTCSA